METKKSPTTKGLLHKRCVLPGRLDGKTAIVTGASGGIGMYTTAELARRGALVIMASRDMDKTREAKEKLMSLYSEKNAAWNQTDLADPSLKEHLKAIKDEQLVPEQLDLGSLESIRQFAKRISDAHPKVDYLINNAGITVETYQKTKDGFEVDMGVNHLGHFLLTQLLLPVIKAAAPSRIIIVSAAGHLRGQLYKPDLLISEEKFNWMDAYNSSKLANVMYATELSKRLEGTNVTVVSIHPGIVQTELMRHAKSWGNWLKVEMMKPFTVSPWDGAQTTLYTVLADNLIPGAYYSNCAQHATNKLVESDEERKWLWEKSCELVGLNKDG